MLNPGKRARHSAAEIIILETREERAQALSEVPEDLQPLVKEMVSNEFEVSKYLRAYRRSLQGAR